jgi:alkane 1-monooxygenase
MPLVFFASTYTLPILAVCALAFGGLWAWALPVVVFGLLPLVELGLAGDHLNRSDEASRRQNRSFDRLLYLAVPLQLGLVVALGARASSLALPELLGCVASVGICCGAFGINVAHELGHRADKTQQRLAQVLLLTSLYMHFFVEHNRGHHARVATPEDPASARYGEALFPFWARSIVGSWRSAWHLEATRLPGRIWSWQNAMVRYLVIQGAAIASFFLIFGSVGGLAFLGAAAVGILLLETVNYVEHYGLERERSGDRWERVRPAHSWTSDRPLSRALLFELTRHADHHAHPGRPYQVLRHFEDAPELPTGYAGMILLAFFPPLFRRVMDRQLFSERARLAA